MIKHKIEIRDKAFYVYDIFGLESLKKLKYDKNSEASCSVCLDNNISVISLPCRHMCLCIECTKLFG